MSIECIMIETDVGWATLLGIYCAARSEQRLMKNYPGQQNSGKL